MSTTHTTHLLVIHLLFQNTANPIYIQIKRITNVFSPHFQGGFYCGTCKIGWVGDAFYGCRPANFCASGENNCDEHADCIYTGPGEFKCIVSIISIIGLVKMISQCCLPITN